MRRKEREVTDFEQIHQLLDENQVLRIAMTGLDGYPYILPVNYCYQWQDDLIFYIHGAQRGKKITCLKENPKVAVEIDDAHQLLSGGMIPCHYSYGYRSLIGYGMAEMIEDQAEKRQVLEMLLQQLVKDALPPEMQELLPGALACTAVIKITIHDFTVKAHQQPS